MRTDFNEMNDQEVRESSVSSMINVSAEHTSSPYASPAAQSFPVELAPEALHGLAGEIVGAATSNSEAHPAGVLMTLLAHAGITVGRGAYLSVGDTYHHARLFVAIVGRSARARKGTSEGPIRRIGDRTNKSLRELNWSSGPLSSGEGLIYAIRDADEQEDGQCDPGVPDKRLLVTESEFAAPLRAMQRAGNTLSATLRAAWDGKTLEPLTKNSRIRASKPHLGIVAHITQEELRQLLGHVELFNGFANRFLWTYVERPVLRPLAAGMSSADVIRLGDEYAKRLVRAQSVGEVEFSQEARELYKQLYADLSEDHDGIYGVVVARAEAQVIRLALTFALIEGAPSITADHLQAAIAVWEYCDQSARYLFGEASGDPLQNRILVALADGPLTNTEIHKVLGNHTPGHELNSALKNLQANGRIECSKRSTGGRSSNVWSLRPQPEAAKQAKKATECDLQKLN